MNFRRCFRVFVLAVVLIGIRIAPVGANSRATIAAVAPVLAGPLILTASVSGVPNTILATQIGTAFVWGAIIQKIPDPTLMMSFSACGWIGIRTAPVGTKTLVIGTRNLQYSARRSARLGQLTIWCGPLYRISTLIPPIPHHSYRTG